MALPLRFRRAVVPVAVVTSVLMLASACGGDDDKKADGSPSATKTSAASPTGTDAPASPDATSPAGGSGKPSATGGTASGTPLTEAQLKKVILGQADVPANVKVAPFSANDQEAQADEASCQPVLDVLSGGVTAGKAAADTGNRFLIDDDENDVSVILLASYANGGAKKLVDDATAALASCASIPASKAGSKVTFTTEKVDLTSKADATLGIALVTSAGSQSIPTDYAIIQVGDMLAIFVNLNTETGEAEMPDRQLLDAQAEKMRAAHS
ncbi:hypothetical protein [Yinghuangia sp. YIM S09857]|uniref:hypothetical protein n=1 Tax=Yinghuangia sp. YIM S09857 TaxID=3436929 RepID=UPI003F52FA2F